MKPGDTIWAISFQGVLIGGILRKLRDIYFEIETLEPSNLRRMLVLRKDCHGSLEEAQKAYEVWKVFNG